MRLLVGREGNENLNESPSVVVPVSYEISLLAVG